MSKTVVGHGQGLGRGEAAPDVLPFRRVQSGRSRLREDCGTDAERIAAVWAAVQRAGTLKDVASVPEGRRAMLDVLGLEACPACESHYHPVGEACPVGRERTVE